jgi:subtilisin family serine protease
VQFIGPIKDAWLRQITRAGGELRDPYGDFAYIVRATREEIQKIAALDTVRWTGHLPYDARISSNLQRRLNGEIPPDAPTLPRTRILPSVYTVEFFGSEDVTAAVSEVKQLGFKILLEDPDGKILVVETRGGRSDPAKQIEALSEVHGVRKIRERAINRPSNDVATGIMGTDVATSTAGTKGLGLTGKGEIIGVCDTGLDTGDPATIHQDFQGRIKILKSYPITSDYSPFIKNPGANDGPSDLDSGHGTHVTGSIVGTGASSLTIPGIARPIRGLAHQARVVFQAVEQQLDWKSAANAKKYGRYLLAGIPANIADLFDFAYQQGARIHSNSWGGGNPGEYDEQCRQLDRYIWEHKDFCVLVAAGNDGTDSDADGKINPMSVTSPATAKNCITVGACENYRLDFNAETYGIWWPTDYPGTSYRKAPMADNPDHVAAFSSRGPTRDNRMKPDVVAPGTFILSARSSLLSPSNTGWAPFPLSKSYFYMGGTSMATPLAAGAVALIREYLRTRTTLTKPTAALLKATLIAGTSRLPGIAPAGTVVDNHQGYGRINVDSVLAPKKPGVTNFVDVKKGLRTGDVHTVTVKLKSNKVPLRIVLAYTDFPGATLVNNLNLIVTAPDGSKIVGNQKISDPIVLDAKNNVEVVQIDKPQAGTWKIEIVGANIPKGPQDFAVVYMGHT